MCVCVCLFSFIYIVCMYVYIYICACACVNISCMIMELDFHTETRSHKQTAFGIMFVVMTPQGLGTGMVCGSVGLPRSHLLGLEEDCSCPPLFRLNNPSLGMKTIIRKKKHRIKKTSSGSTGQRPIQRCRRTRSSSQCT